MELITTADGVDLPCHVNGDDGPPLVFVHGGGSRASQFLGLFPRLEGHFRAVAYDQRGFGATRVPHDAEIDHEHWARDLEQVLDDFEFENVRLCGWSLGAVVALNVATRQPDRVAGMVLLGAPSPNRPLNARLFDERLKIYAESSSVEEAVAAYFPTVRNMFSPWTLTHRPEAVRAVWYEQLDNDPAIVPRVVSGYATRPDLSGSLAGVKCHVHLVTGEDDHTCDLRGARELGRAFSSASMSVVAQCGHYYAVEQPDLVVRHLLDGLEIN